MNYFSLALAFIAGAKRLILHFPVVVRIRAVSLLVWVAAMSLFLAHIIDPEE